MAKKTDKANKNGVTNNDALIAQLEAQLATAQEKLALGKAMITYYVDGLQNQYTDSYHPANGIGSGLPAFFSDLSAYYMNSAVFLNHFYPDGAEKTELKIHNPYFPLLNPLNEFVVYGAKSTKTVDPNGWFRFALQGMWLKQRISYLTSQTSSSGALSKNVEDIKTKLAALGVKDVDIQTIVDTGQIPSDYGKLKLEYNVGMVKEAYFASSKGFQDLAKTMKGNNRPSKVTEAGELWAQAKSNKGMVWLYYPKEAADVWSWEPENFSPIDKKRYAFQFHYNPATVSMGYAGAPDLDVAMLTSGADKSFNYLGDKTMSTISFQLVFNRVTDFQYYEPTDTGGRLIADFGDVYAGNQPTKADQKRIYNYGTMYDVEFLLATIMGFKFKSRLRGKTSDIGFLAGRPVDLHLGKGLRYWGYISSLGVDHKIFDERMVPIFTVLDITFNRIPDYEEFQGGTPSTFNPTTSLSNVNPTSGPGIQ